MVKFGRIVLSGAGFTKAICSDAPLLFDAIDKTIEHTAKTPSLSQSLIPVCGAYYLHNQLSQSKPGKINIEDMFNTYFHLEDKKSSKGLSESEFKYQTHFGFFKMAFVHLLTSTTPWNHNHFRNNQKYNHRVAEYFLKNFGDAVQITLNYDTLLESLFDSFPDALDHVHQIQHLHGSLAWEYYGNALVFDVSKIRNTRGNDVSWNSIIGETSSDCIIYPTSRKDILKEKFKFYQEKEDRTAGYFKNAKEISIIGVGFGNNDVSLQDLVKKSPRECKITYIGKDEKLPDFIVQLAKEREVWSYMGGFELDCLEELQKVST